MNRGHMKMYHKKSTENQWYQRGDWTTEDDSETDPKDHQGYRRMPPNPLTNKQRSHHLSWYHQQRGHQNTRPSHM